MQENGLIRNVNFKIYDVTNWEKINYDTHIANISRSKHNQKMKYDQLVEYNFKIIFLKIHTQNTVVELFPNPFLKNQD